VGRTFAIVVGGTICVIGVACSLTTSFDGLSGGAPTEAGLYDAGDAAPDAAFCALTPDASFCDDFERENPGSGWDLVAVTADASLTITRAPSTASGVLHAAVPFGIPGVGIGSASLGKSFGPSTRARVSFDVLVEALGASPGALLQVYSEADAATTIEELRLSAASTSLHEGVFLPDGGRSASDQPLRRNLAVGVWERISVELAMDASPPTISIRFGTEVVLPPTPVRARVGTVGLYLPLSFFPLPSEAWSIDVDNLVVELSP
jgi:hypothetical protein